MNPDTLTEAFAPTRQLLQQLLAFAPRLVMSLVVMIVGLLVARFARQTTLWLVQKSGLEALVERVGIARLLYGVGIKRGFAQVLARIAWIATLLITLSVVAEMVGLPGVADGINVLLEFLPHLIAATMIVVAGLVAADMLRSVVERVGADREDLESPAFLGRVVYYITATVSFSLAAEHLGLEVDLINALIQIAAAAGLLSLGLSFALASRFTFRDIVSRHYAQRIFRPGDHIVLDDIEGRVVRYGPVSAWVETEAGTVIVPCSSLMTRPVTITDIAD